MGVNKYPWRKLKSPELGTSRGCSSTLEELRSGDTRAETRFLSLETNSIQGFRAPHVLIIEPSWRVDQGAPDSGAIPRGGSYYQAKCKSYPNLW